MPDSIKQHKEAILTATLTVIATGLVVGVTYALTKQFYDVRNAQAALHMSRIAHEAGVLDQLIEHQQKHATLINVK